MAKRFYDTTRCDEEWFMNLSLKGKCLLRYLEDKCDVAGMWSPNWKLASTYIGTEVTAVDLEELGDQVRILEDGKVFLVGFVEFQYGELSENCKPHQKVIALLVRYGLYIVAESKKNKGYPKGIHTLQEKEEDKDKEKDKEKGGVGEKTETDQNPKQPKKAEDKNSSSASDIFAQYPFTTPEFMLLWRQFVEMRVKKRKPLSPRAIMMSLNKLQELSGGSPGKAMALMDQTLLHSWDTFFPLKAPTTAYTPQQQIFQHEQLSPAQRAQLRKQQQ